MLNQKDGKTYDFRKVFQNKIYLATLTAANRIPSFCSLKVLNKKFITV